MYRVQMHSYCGLSNLPITFDESGDARDCAASKLRRARRRFRVVTLERGKQWEIQEPEDCAMVPDACGTLAIHHTTFECRECGSDHETREHAGQCCAFNDEEIFDYV